MKEEKIEIRVSISREIVHQGNNGVITVMAPVVFVEFDCLRRDLDLPGGILYERYLDPAFRKLKETYDEAVGARNGLANNPQSGGTE